MSQDRPGSKRPRRASDLYRGPFSQRRIEQPYLKTLFLCPSWQASDPGDEDALGVDLQDLWNQHARRQEVSKLVWDPSYANYQCQAYPPELELWRRECLRAAEIQSGALQDPLDFVSSIYEPTREATEIFLSSDEEDGKGRSSQGAKEPAQAPDLPAWPKRHLWPPATIRAKSSHNASRIRNRIAGKSAKAAAVTAKSSLERASETSALLGKEDGNSFIADKKIHPVSSPVAEENHTTSVVAVKAKKGEGRRKSFASATPPRSTAARIALTPQMHRPPSVPGVDPVT